MKEIIEKILKIFEILYLVNKNYNKLKIQILLGLKIFIYFNLVIINK